MKIFTKERFLYLLIPFVVAGLNFLIIMFPKVMISAAKNGVGLWFFNVLPAVLPFVIGGNMLMELGFVKFLGVLLEPIMYLIFRVSGAGSFAMVMGFMSGYPMGAKITSQLRINGDLSRHEAQRLMSFCNNAGPLFVIGTIGTVMFKNPQIGYYILFVHYISAIIVGLLFRRYKKEELKPSFSTRKVFKRAYAQMRDERKKRGRSFGEILGISVKQAMETMLLIGGFIVLFCVIIEVINLMDLPSLLNLPPSSPLVGIIGGFVEITNGTAILSNLPGMTPVFITCGLISWGGLSVFAQSVSFLSKTDISPLIYMFSKLLQGTVALIISFVSYPFFKDVIEKGQAVAVSTSQNPVSNGLSNFFSSISGLVICVFCLLCIGILCQLIFNAIAVIRRS